MATQPPHVMRGLDPQQAFELVANAYIAAAVRTVNTPAARERFTEQAEHWLAAMNGLLEPDWWPMWPEAHQDEFRNDMERVRAVYATASLSNPLRDGMVGTRMLSTELKHMRNTFNRIDYIVTKISRTPPSHADPEQWRLATRTWFRDGVARHLTAREFDTQGYSLRMDVVDEFDTQAAQAVAAAYVAAGLRTDPSPAAREGLVERRNEWLVRFNEWLEPDWWPMWTEAKQDALLDELEAVRARYAAGQHQDLDSALFGCDTLNDMRMSFCRLAYYVSKIASLPPACADPEQWRLTANEWFREGVTGRISAWEFDDEDMWLRTDVLREFYDVRCKLDQTRRPTHSRLHALPPLNDVRAFRQLHRLIQDAEEMRVHRSEQRHHVRQREHRRVNADLDRFRQDEPGADRREEEAEMHRAFARSRGIPIPTSPTHGPPGGGGAAHSLAHRSSARAMLSLRQQAVYGRGVARY
ncbi:hypothetical protein JCM9279_005297 [Rhodotorula babjevae]